MQLKTERLVAITMGEHETGKLEAESSCHDVQGDDFMREAKFQLESLDFEPSLFETNVVNSTRNDILKVSILGREFLCGFLKRLRLSIQPTW